MSFEALVNLHRIGQLDAVPFSAELLEKMLNVAHHQFARRSKLMGSDALVNQMMFVWMFFVGATPSSR
jgi:hypothetical protein